MNLAETAEYNGISLDALLRLIIRKEITYSRKPGRLTTSISRKDADEYLRLHNTISSSQISTLTGARLCI